MPGARTGILGAERERKPVPLAEFSACVAARCPKTELELEPEFGSTLGACSQQDPSCCL